MRKILLLSVVCLALVFFGFSCNFALHSKCQLGRTAILGAFDEETALLKQQLSNRKDYSFEGISFFTGTLNNKKVILAETGIGKVNAAMTTTLVIAYFKPDEVIFSGIAGSTNPSLQPGDIIIAERTAHHDYGLVTEAGMETTATINPIDNNHNPVFLAADERLLSLAKAAAKEVSLSEVETTEGPVQPKIISGVVVTGDGFIDSDKFSWHLRENLGADAVEMEGAAVAQICYQRKIPCIVIRSISDKADEKAVSDLEKFYKTAARNSAKLVAEMMRQLGQSNRPD